MKTWKSFSRTPLALLTSSLVLGTVPIAMADDATAALTPEVLFHFTGDDKFGTHWGKDPLVPPVMGNDGNLYGGTQYGDGAINSGAVQVGVAYTFNPVTDVYSATSMGDLGALYSPLIASSEGKVYGAVRFSNIDTNGGYLGKGLVYSQNAEGVTRYALPANGITPEQANLQPGGQMALDNAGNLYVPVGRTTGACTTTNSDVQNNLYRVNSGGVFERLINLCNFRSGGTTAATQIQPFGSGAIAYLWSSSDTALYVLSTVATSSSTDGVRPTAALLRITQANLEKGLANNGAVDETDIELLHTFSSGAGGGSPQGANVRVSTLVEDGDWIYGTSFYDGYDGTTLRGSGKVWRINKKQAGSFAIVHNFRAGASVDTKTADPADGTDSADGFQPSGPLAVAVDGNIYGTTLSDARTFSVSTGSVANAGRITPNGAGTLFRINVGTAADRVDDRVEVLHRFDIATQGKSPAGLSVGAIANGAQQLYGVTREGEAATANGVLYSLAVPLAGEGSLTLSTTTNEVAASETVSLSWTNPWLTQGCSLDLKEGGNNLSALGGDGSYNLADLLARSEPVEGISINGDLAAGNISFPLTANASYELSCPEPFTGYQGELLSQRVAFTLLVASSSSSREASSSAVSSSASSVATSASSSSQRSGGGGGGSIGLTLLAMLSLVGMAQWGRRKS